MQQSLLFGQVFDKIFTADIHGRFNCKQISLVMNEYYNSVNRPDLKLTPHQVGSRMSYQPEIDKTRHGCLSYHISIRPEWEISETLRQNLGKTSVKTYDKSFIRIGTDSDNLV